MAFLKRFAIFFITASVMWTIVFHAIDYTHVHPGDVVKSGYAHVAHAVHDAHTASTPDTGGVILPDASYMFHYREGEETLTAVLIGILFGAIWLCIPPIPPRKVLGNVYACINKTTGTYMRHVLPQTASLNIFNAITRAFRSGRIRNIQYG